MSVVALVNTQIEQATFEDFWVLYPRRVAKKDAAKAWARMSETDRMAAVTALVTWRRVWAAKEMDYIPYPASWLNGERWTDEPPTVLSTTHASHVLASATPGSCGTSSTRTAMPEHVRDLIAKLRAK